MKINNSIILNKLNMGIDNELFKEGDILDGEILNISDNIATIEIEDLGIIKAFVEKNLEHHDGRTSKFLVESSSQGKVELRYIPLGMESKGEMESSNKGKDYLSHVLKGFHIKDDPISMEVLETLIKYNVDINEENLVKAIRIYDKLDHLINTEKEEVIILLNQKYNYDVKKVNIEKILVKDIKSSDMLQSESTVVNEQDVTIAVNEYLKNGHLDYKSESDLIKTIGFFIKFNINPTLNNFRYILELQENSLLFSEDFKILEEIIDKKFTNLVKRVNIDKGSYNISVGKSNNDLKKVLNKIEEFIREDSSSYNKTIRQTIKELENKMEFIDEMNNELSFVYFPLNINEKDYKGLITMFENKKKKDGCKGRFNIFIDLKTKRLGDVKISCQVKDFLINIKFINISKKDFDLFKSKEDRLRNLVDSSGYSVTDVEYLLTDEYSILDSLVVNKNSTYFLDVQV